MPGLRTHWVSLITTLLETTKYSPLEVLRLSGEPWSVELNLRHLNTTLGMDILRCKTPSMVRTELSVYWLAYNLLCALMWEAGTTYGTPPLRRAMQPTSDVPKAEIVLMPLLWLWLLSHDGVINGRLDRLQQRYLLTVVLGNGNHQSQFGRDRNCDMVRSSSRFPESDWKQAIQTKSNLNRDRGR